MSVQWGWSGLATATAVGLTVGLGALSRVPYEADGADHAALRLAWRVRGVRVEECRTLSAEELEEIPAHMRRTEVCEGRVLPHRLVVSVDDSVVVNDLVRAAGAREDRPIYVFYDLALPAGQHRVAVAFTREGDEPPDVDEAAPPGRLDLATTVTLRRKEVALVTYDRDRRALTLEGYGR